MEGVCYSRWNETCRFIWIMFLSSKIANDFGYLNYCYKGSLAVLLSVFVYSFSVYNIGLKRTWAMQTKKYHGYDFTSVVGWLVPTFFASLFSFHSYFEKNKGNLEQNHSRVLYCEYCYLYKLCDHFKTLRIVWSFRQLELNCFFLVVGLSACFSFLLFK